MNIVLVNIWLDTERGGGTAERTRHLALHLAKLGCRCTIVTMGQTPWASDFSRAGIDVVTVRFIGQRFPIPMPNLLDLARRLRNADVVHIMGFWYLLADLCRVLAAMSHTPTVICPAGALTHFGRSMLLKKAYFFVLGRRTIDSAASIIATTRQERARLISDFAVRETSVFLSPNGIEPPTETGQPDVDVPSGRIILFVGRLVAIKGPDLLLEAFSQLITALPDAQLVIAGPDFGMRPQLEQRVTDLGLAQRVHFAGFLPEMHRTEWLRKASLLVVPSHSEVMSMVALEAGAMGVPVVLTNGCGFDEVAEIGGGLVVPATSTAISKAILDMMTKGPELNATGERLRRFVLDNYAWPKVATDALAHFGTLRKRA